MDTRPRTLPAPRKDLSKIAPKRKRPSKAVKPTTTTTQMEIDSLIDALIDDTTLLEVPEQPPVQYYYTHAGPSQPPLPQIDDSTLLEMLEQPHYYTHAEPSQPPPPPPPPPPPSPTPSPAVLKPQLLIRQVYKLATEACAVVGIECVKGFMQAIYLVNNNCSVTLDLEDLISLRSTSIVTTLNRHMSGDTAAAAVPFQPYHLSTIVIEPSGDKSIRISNYHVNVGDNATSCWKSYLRSKCDIIKSSGFIQLHRPAWDSLKRHFDCIESYYSISSECSSVIEHLVWRYTQYLTRHYKSEVFRSGRSKDGINPELIQHIGSDLPLFMQELCEKRLPPDSKHAWCQPSSIQPPLLAWLDSEVRRYCAPHIFNNVIETLKRNTLW